jgi:deazaflavin-dependent oxidoreductase (nitroreductase family)
MAANAFLLRASRGRIGGQLGSQTILLLHTTGRRSGQARVTPIAYFTYEDGWLIVASNWGKDTEADWYLNLKRNPRATLEINGRAIPVQSREAQGEEYARAWKFASQRHPQYLRYQALTRRHIPVMLFRPV